MLFRSAVSIVSAVMHNLTQNVVFCLVSNTPQMFSYMPWLALLGVLAGIIVGFAVWFILKMVPTRTFASILNLDVAPLNNRDTESSSSKKETEFLPDRIDVKTEADTDATDSDAANADGK